MLPRPKLPPLPKPSDFAGRINPLHRVIEDIRRLIHDGEEEVRNIASSLHVEVPQPPQPKAESEESCPVCSELTDLKEYLGKRKVKMALSELEKSGDKESVQTVKAYIEGEDVD